MKKTCPKCKKEYDAMANYCGRCGIELTRELNRCSKQRHALCRDKDLPDDQRFCIYCGALTTYELAKRDGDW